LNHTTAQGSNEGAKEEHYIAGYGSRVTKEILAKRSASVEAAFFLPHLHAGMRLLDCGCGPGTITVNLAEVVAPGEVVGLDIEDKQFEIGRAYARERDVSNVRFETGNIYDLAFPSASFDAVFAHAILYHLKTPGSALTELHRILKPGGVVGIRDLDNGGTIFAPSNQKLGKARRRQRATLREVGFVNVQASASYDSYGTPETTRNVGDYLAELLLQPRLSDVIIEQKWADRSELQDMSAAFKAWGRHPDAFSARARCEAVGWKK
jgi:ubiquinone/menaquinone biosynthesis C-methylase UbiE